MGFTWEHPAHPYFSCAKSGGLLFGGPAGNARGCPAVSHLTASRGDGLGCAGCLGELADGLGEHRGLV